VRIEAADYRRESIGAAADESGEADDLADPDGQTRIRQAALSAHIVENQKIITGFDVGAMRFDRVERAAFFTIIEMSPS
jgi:hypothetical protein